MHFFSLIYIYNKGITLNLNGPWNPYGIVHGIGIWKFHGIHMESTWTGPWNVHGMVHSIDIPYGIHSGYGMGNWVGAQPKKFHMESMEWGVESTHSIWNPYGRYRGV